jgi:hypothetical protein
MEKEGSSKEWKVKLLEYSVSMTMLEGNTTAEKECGVDQ